MLICKSNANAGIEVEGSLSFGVRVDSSSLLNDGILTIKDIQQDGLIVINQTSVIENSGTINIQNVNVSESPSTFGIDGTSGCIKNYSSGNIYISNVNGILGSISGMSLMTGLTFTNFGDLSISNSDAAGMFIINTQFNNYGDILLESLGGSGIALNGTFNNNSNARIILDKLDANGLNCASLSIFDNSGEVMSRMIKGIAFSTNGSVINSGNISLIDGDLLGIFLSSSDASFMNLGYIDIDQCTKGVLNRGGFVNKGIIEIDNIINAAIVNENIFENKDSIFIQNAWIGLQNDGQFINEDYLIIHSSGLQGILNSDTFNLKAGALIEINGVSDPASTALLNENPNSLFSVDGSIAISNASNNGFTVLQGNVYVDNPGNVSTNNTTDIKFEVQLGAELTIGHEIDIGN